MVTWEPRGRLFPPKNAPSWIGGYAALPFAVPSNDGTSDRTARVFFSGRDAQNRSHVGACSIDLDRLSVDATSITPEPLLSPGPLGAFDDSGCSMSSIVEHGGRTFLYYTGWMLGRSVPFYLAVGLAASDDGGRTFNKVSPAPVLDRSSVDPFLTASPSVLLDGGVWRMWYASALEWESRPEGPRHRYLIKYAESRDGISWKRDGLVALPFAGENEYAMGRPHVVKDGSVYRMWTCIRGDRYRIVAAESDDGFVWRRTTASAPPAQEWDAEMQAYPMALRDRSRWILFYNGNGYGATGFGCATMMQAGS